MLWLPVNLIQILKLPAFLSGSTMEGLKVQSSTAAQSSIVTIPTHMTHWRSFNTTVAVFLICAWNTNLQLTLSSAVTLHTCIILKLWLWNPVPRVGHQRLPVTFLATLQRKELSFLERNDNVQVEMNKKLPYMTQVDYSYHNHLHLTLIRPV